MKILSFSSFSDGYIPGSIPLNQDEGYLEIGHPASCHLRDYANIIAETLSLRCALHPLAYEDLSLNVQLISENTSLESVTLYGSEAIVGEYEREVSCSHYHAVAILYRGQGIGKRAGGETFLVRGTTFPAGHLEISSPLYIKPFRTEKEKLRIRMTTVGAGQVLTSPPGAVNTCVLRDYGGYYKPGAPLALCEQIYYALSSDYEKTRVCLYPSSTLKAQGAPPPEGGRLLGQDVLFSPPLREEEQLSLMGAIAAGYARLSIVTDFGTLHYASYLAEPSSEHPHFITIHFSIL